MVRLETERLIIRDHTSDDIEDVHGLLSDPEGMFYLEDIETHTVAESRENLEVSVSQAQSKDRSKFFFGIYQKESDKYMGEIGYTIELDSEEGPLLEMGYFIRKEFWGLGYTFEAARAVVDYAFVKLNAYKIEAGCVKGNVASERIMIKLGMTKEAERRKHQKLRGRLYDRVEYGILREEWI